MTGIIQDPAPGTHVRMFRGDTLTFTFSQPANEKGDAWLRTNIGHAGIFRKEIIREVILDDPPKGRDWFDIPMTQTNPGTFQATVPLCEVGHFQAKCFFIKQGDTQPKWPGGLNTIVNVDPSDTCCSNIIYNAFVRQFGPNKNGTSVLNPSKHDLVKMLDKAGYTVIPPSGTFRDLIGELDFIIHTLGCRIIHLLPVHPTPTTYARMGRFGSPYAALNFTAVDPALSHFDPSATPLEQFGELVDEIHRRHAQLFMDIAINHTGWAAGLHETHPQWLVRDKDGRIQVPSAWGVEWSDLTRLDYSNKDLWKHMAHVFLTWCRRGVDGFRCDAGYMIPVPAWTYIVAEVREQFPDTIFFLEGLGGQVSVTQDILNKASFNWAYSELFQNYDRNQIETYLPHAMSISNQDGNLIHFAETHDNNRLAARSPKYARMRTTLCALLSHEGGFGFANGVEWYATEKIIVHEASSLNWGAKINQVGHIRKLSSILKKHPAFFHKTRLSLIQQTQENTITLFRHHLPTGKKLIIVANLDDENQALGSWTPQNTGHEKMIFVDLLTDKELVVNESQGLHTLILEPGEVLCLSPDKEDIHLVTTEDIPNSHLPWAIEWQRYRAKALDIWKFYNGVKDMGPCDPDQIAKDLKDDPLELCRRTNPYSQETRVVTWQWPRDDKREVMIPPNHFLLVRSDTPFCTEIIDKTSDPYQVMAKEKSMVSEGKYHFTLFSPLPAPSSHCPYTLKLTLYTNEITTHWEAPLLYLSQPEDIYIQKVFSRSEVCASSLYMVGTNNRGGMLRANASWGKLRSKYDALLAANLNPDFPEDRRIMFTRCRAFIVYQDYSKELRPDLLDIFRFDYNSRGVWRFHVPVGQGQHITLSICIEMIKNENTICMNFFREPAKEFQDKLMDDKPVRLILRPDIEDRSFHENTKAYTGPESWWEKCITPAPNGFRFMPDKERRLGLSLSEGDFTLEPEWHYMVKRPMDAERGLDPNSDLFSPGYFSTFMNGGKRIQLWAQVDTKAPQKKRSLYVLPNNRHKALHGLGSVKERDSFTSLKKALDSYVVQRNGLKTVIAGYPWFLDWGRDSLIFSRGLIADGRTEDAKAILKQFGRFEKYGTLPNMIQGNNGENRDTSDAPLWFFVACADLVNAEESFDFLEESCGTRTIGQVLLSMGQSLVHGTPNGIKIDSETGLMFSPAHFTWMDTNHPAGSPRMGYPIEIQALWHAALSFLSSIDTSYSVCDWKKLANQVQKSIHDLFWLNDKGYLCDCLHAPSSEHSAAQAEKDDALRPNQLLAITLLVITDPSMCRNILSACEALLVPGGVRSLADQPVQYPLEVIHNGNLINNPHYPYHGRYEGDEDTNRKPAYHNGTAWTWLLPIYCEAWGHAYGDKGKETAMSWLGSSTRLVNQGCAGHVPEILDGDFPHRPRGCDAQAWGVSELVRVWEKLIRKNQAIPYPFLNKNDHDHQQPTNKRRNHEYQKAVS
ncbi:MAG: glycogen debranching protein [Desulfobacterales bacterium]|nr:glycogen debranching protein [Desulfobacterales bacterium]